MQRKQCKKPAVMLHKQMETIQSSCKQQGKGSREVATWEKRYKKFLELHIQRFQFYSYSLFTPVMSINCKRLDLESPCFK